MSFIRKIFKKEVEKPLEETPSQKYHRLRSVPELEELKFIDYKGRVAVTIKSKNLLYIESISNNVVIHYRDNIFHKTKTIRNTLKCVETSLSNSCLEHCAKSVAINKHRYKELVTVDGVYMLRLKGSRELVPVSAKYATEKSKKRIHSSFRAAIEQS